MCADLRPDLSLDVLGIQHLPAVSERALINKRRIMMTEKTGTCGCGRSPTGDCIGWHKLSEEGYQVKLAEYHDVQTTDSAAGENDQSPNE